MRVRWLGWAGVEIEADGKVLVVDPLTDPASMWAPLGERAREVPMPELARVSRSRQAVAGLVTHLHRDHADAAALAEALADGAPVLRPQPGDGSDREERGLMQAEAEFAAAGLAVRLTEPWQSAQIGPFTLTALPAVDGSGDPQVSWLIEAENRRVLHCGDTLFHGYWWRFALRHGPIDLALLPINGAEISFPHRQPPSPYPAVMDPEQAATAAVLLGARTAVPIHYGGYEVDPYYRPVDDAAQRFLDASVGTPFAARSLRVGESLEI